MREEHVKVCQGVERETDAEEADECFEEDTVQTLVNSNSRTKKRTQSMFKYFYPLFQIENFC